MDGSIISLGAVIMSLGIPLGAMYLYYRRAPAAHRGASGGHGSRRRRADRTRRFPGGAFASRRHSAGLRRLGFRITFGLIAQMAHQPETWVAASFGILPLAVGLGYFLDWTLIRGDLHPSN
jgi:hypothetical protein